MVLRIKDGWLRPLVGIGGSILVTVLAIVLLGTVLAVLSALM